MTNSDAPSQNPSPGTAGAAGASAGGGVVSQGWLSAQSVFEHHDDRRIAPAFGVSLALHFGIAVLVFLILAVGPGETLAPIIQPIRVVYLDVPGPGGGGGGSPSPAPPKPVEIPKTRAPEVVPVIPPVPTPQTPPKPTLTAPVMTNNAELVQATGATSVSLSPYAGGGQGRGLGEGRGSGVGAGEGGGFGGGAFRPGAGISGPKLVTMIRPAYTPEAMRAKIQGEVQLEAVVQTDGTIGDVRVIKSLDRNMGLDNEAIKAARRWVFAPGKDREGRSVPVIIVMVLEFNLY